jgi:hypothetical protein
MIQTVVTWRRLATVYCHHRHRHRHLQHTATEEQKQKIDIVVVAMLLTQAMMKLEMMMMMMPTMPKSRMMRILMLEQQPVEMRPSWCKTPKGLLLLLPLLVETT